jgi:hypothetical protein
MKLCFGLLLLALGYATGSFITMKDGYFYDPSVKKYWFPQGISYQTWIGDTGEWQTEEQIDFDLRNMRSLHVNSIRIDMAWKNIEYSPGLFNFTKYDYIVKMSKKYGIRVFALVGYQFPPSWSPGVPFTEGNNVDSGYYTMHPPGPGASPPNIPPPRYYTEKWVSDNLSYENPSSVSRYQLFVQTIAQHYRNETAIVAFILGNEMGYLGLWTYRFDGYDTWSQTAFRNYLLSRYNNITALNALWQTNYDNFTQVTVPETYDRDSVIWGDAIQWRQHSIATFVAGGAKAVKQVDTDHLLSYSSIGMLWGYEDWRYHAESPRHIATACTSVNASLDFWSINNYPDAYNGSETISGHWGFTRAQWTTSLPVLLTETGFTTTETNYDALPQPFMLKTTIWDSIMSGSIGVHVFHWADRRYLPTREVGFGIYYRNRYPKLGMFTVCDLFGFFDQIDIVNNYLVKSTRKKVDVAFYWTSETDQMINRYMANMQGIYGGLLRKGYGMRFMNKEELYSGAYKNITVLILPRNERMGAGELAFINKTVIPYGVHVYADADLPGYKDYYLRDNSDFTSLMDHLFGIKVEKMNQLVDIVIPYTYYTYYEPLSVFQNSSLSTQMNVTGNLRTWKFHNISTTSAQVIAYMNGYFGTPQVATTVKTHPSGAKAILSAFALGDITTSDVWGTHDAWYLPMFGTSIGFKTTPEMIITSSRNILVNYIYTANERIIIMVSNMNNETETVTLTMPALLGAMVKHFEDKNKVVIKSSNGTVTLQAQGYSTSIYLAQQPSNYPTIVLDLQHPIRLFPQDSEWSITTYYNTAKYESMTSCCHVFIELKSALTDKSITYNSKRISGLVGTATIPLYIDYFNVQEITNGHQETDFYIRSWLSLDGGNGTYSSIAETSTNVLFVNGIKPLDLPTNMTVNSPVNITVSINQLDETYRRNLFPGFVAILNSTRTSAVDSTHSDKVKYIAQVLEKLGYKYTRYAVPTDMIQNDNETVSFYSIVDEESSENYDYHYLANMFTVLILPGVSVIDKNATNNIARFLEIVPESVVITTEGNLNSIPYVTTIPEPYVYDMRTIFGVSGNTTVLDNSTLGGAMSVNLTNNNHAATRYLHNFTSLVHLEGLIEYKTIQGVSTGIPLAKLSVFGKEYPALVYNKFGVGYTLMMNFDPQLIPEPTHLQLWKGISEWMHTYEAIYKLRWRLACGQAESALYPLTLEDKWVVRGRLNLTYSVNPQSKCRKFYKPNWTGYTYKFNTSNPYVTREGYFTSRFYRSYWLRISNCSFISPNWILLILLLINTVQF